MSKNVAGIEVKLFKGVSRQDTNIYEFYTEELDRQLLDQIMPLCHYNQSKAARLLGISRGNLRTKLEKLWPGRYCEKRS